MPYTVSMIATAVFLILHGAIHLLRTTVSWRLAEPAGFASKACALG